MINEKLLKKTDDGELKTYTCPWPNCGLVFEQRVRRVGGDPDGKGGKFDAVSSMVVCPRCGNGLKTWGE